MAETIRVPHNLGYLEYNPKDLQKDLEDYQFLLDSVLVLINPKEAEKSDLSFDKETTIEYIKQMFEENNRGYSKEFLKNIFN